MRNNFSPSQTYKVDFASVELLSGADASVVFSVDSTQVFREDQEISPITLTDGTQYMPWGVDDNMPYHILDLIEKDETLSTCQMFNAEICYGNWKKSGINADEIEFIPLLNPYLPWLDLQERMVEGKRKIIDFLTGAENSGKSQSNNSGSDKRELYTIAQALQKPYHDLLFTVHLIIMKFNNWVVLHLHNA